MQDLHRDGEQVLQEDPSRGAQGRLEFPLDGAQGLQEARAGAKGPQETLMEEQDLQEDRMC